MRRSEKNDRKINETRITAGGSCRREGFGKSLYPKRYAEQRKELGPSGSFRRGCFYWIYQALENGNCLRAYYPGKKGPGNFSKRTERCSCIPGSENGDWKFPFLCGLFL